MWLEVLQEFPCAVGLEEKREPGSEQDPRDVGRGRAFEHGGKLAAAGRARFLGVYR